MNFELKYLKYNGYVGTLEFDVEGEYLYGKLLYIKSEALVMYSAETLKELKVQFKNAVDEYDKEMNNDRL